VAPQAHAGALQDLERAAILEALQRTHGHKARAAAHLGLTRFQLHTLLKRYHIDPTPR
jgi:transcriptional regulator with GAF, ATPase, and Fis domain